MFSKFATHDKQDKEHAKDSKKLSAEEVLRISKLVESYRQELSARYTEESEEKKKDKAKFKKETPHKGQFKSKTEEKAKHMSEEYVRFLG